MAQELGFVQGLAENFIPAGFILCDQVHDQEIVVRVIEKSKVVSCLCGKAGVLDVIQADFCFWHNGSIAGWR